jgi:hypothetical protein
MNFVETLEYRRFVEFVRPAVAINILDSATALRVWERHYHRAIRVGTTSKQPTGGGILTVHCGN